MWSYSFDTYLREHARALWLSPSNYTIEELKEKCYDDYLEMCSRCNYISDEDKKM